jgi:hypothetical protein
MLNGSFITTKELQDNYGLSRARVRLLQVEHNWKKVSRGLWDWESVSPYLLAAQRTKMLRGMGWVNSLHPIWHDHYDHICPVCEVFAVFKPPTLEETTDSNVEIYGDTWDWVCLNGHHK